jgi:hypothetical protein
MINTLNPPSSARDEATMEDRSSPARANTGDPKGPTRPIR